MDDLSVHDLTAAYALDALDESDLQAYEEHLATCEDCRRELASLSNAAGALAYAVESPAPPAALRERVLQDARAERSNVVPLRARWTPVAKALTAAAACAAIGFGVWAASLSRSLEHERSARDQANRALAVLSDPTASRVALTGAARGSVVITPNGEAALIVSRLDRAPTGKTYEAWVIDKGKPVPAGTFPGGGDTSVLRLERSVPDGARVAVTLEASPGAEQPSGPSILSSNPL
jgi:anti-sigma factor RsiW